MEWNTVEHYGEGRRVESREISSNYLSEQPAVLEEFGDLDLEI